MVSPVMAVNKAAYSWPPGHGEDFRSFSCPGLAVATGGARTSISIQASSPQ